MKIRRPSQAGMFYAGNAEDLKKQIEECFLHKFGPGKIPKVAEKGPRKIVGLICPHAGYMYSGPVAAHAYYRLAIDGKPETFVIMGPNHMGYGSAIALMNEGIWRTPLGDIEIDYDTASKILRVSELIDIDDAAHRYEHSIEVQLPFLQYLYGSEFKFVPIAFLMQDLKSCREIGKALAKALEGRNAVIIASTDMTHYEPHEEASRKDRLALNAVEKMNEEEFYSTIESYRISACGYGPVIALMVASKLLGVKKAEILCYKTSGDIVGDYSSVVGYASACFTR